jgi:phosphoribosylglycinamide formyltransferase 1
MVKKKACVFISGAGTNLKALIHASRFYNFPINISLIISNKKKAGGIRLAKLFSIKYDVINLNNRLHEIKLLNEIKRNKISIICLAGYMKILSKNFINRFKGIIINIHPSLLPKYKGLNTFSRVLKNNEKITGCTVHLVNENLDGGKIILKKKLNISKNEKVESLKKRTQLLEYRAFSESIVKLYRGN